MRSVISERPWVEGGDLRAFPSPRVCTRNPGARNFAAPRLQPHPSHILKVVRTCVKFGAISIMKNGKRRLRFVTRRCRRRVKHLCASHLRRTHQEFLVPRYVHTARYVLLTPSPRNTFTRADNLTAEMPHLYVFFEAKRVYSPVRSSSRKGTHTENDGECTG